MKAFVIMPFRDRFDEMYRSVIVPACTRPGVHPVRADEILDPGSIPEQITQAIRDALFVIVEISQQNDNVFYELGYAHALNKRAILLSDRERHLPFDVRVTRVINYDQRSDMWREKLLQSLEAAIGHLFDLSDRISIFNLQTGQELEGHMHTISGRIINVEFPQHLWFFARREDLDTWWPQDDGEMRVQPDGSWTAQLWLGREDRAVDVDRYYDIKFGLIGASDNRELTELAIRSKFTSH